MCVWLFTVGCESICRELHLCSTSIRAILRAILLLPLSCLVLVPAGLAISLLKLFPCIYRRECAAWTEYLDTIKSGSKAYKEQQHTPSFDCERECRQCAAEAALCALPVFCVFSILLLPIFTLCESLLTLALAVTDGLSACCATPKPGEAFTLGEWWSLTVLALHHHDQQTSLMAWGDGRKSLLCASCTSAAARKEMDDAAAAAAALQLEQDRRVAEELQQRESVEERRQSQRQGQRQGQCQSTEQRRTQHGTQAPVPQGVEQTVRSVAAGVNTAIEVGQALHRFFNRPSPPQQMPQQLPPQPPPQQPPNVVMGSAVHVPVTVPVALPRALPVVRPALGTSTLTQQNVPKAKAPMAKAHAGLARPVRGNDDRM